MQVMLAPVKRMDATTLMNVIKEDTRAMSRLFVPTMREVLAAHARVVTRDQGSRDNVQRKVLKGEFVIRGIFCCSFFSSFPCLSLTHFLSLSVF